jgi:hypothetical protein
VGCDALQGHLLEDRREEIDGGLLWRAIQHDVAQLPLIGMVTIPLPILDLHSLALFISSLVFFILQAIFCVSY